MIIFFTFKGYLFIYLICLLFVLRFLILKKKPTLLKLCCGIAVVIGLFVCLIPTIFPHVDPKAPKVKNEAHGISRVMWPIIFMLGFVSMVSFLKFREHNLPLFSCKVLLMSVVGILKGEVTLSTVTHPRYLSCRHDITCL